MCPKQSEVIEALRKAHGLIEPAAIMLGMSRSNLYQYIGNHSRVAAALKQITAGFVDHVEGRLYKKAVVDEDLNAMKLVLGAKGSDRGYAGGSAAASSDPAVGTVVKLTLTSVPSGFFLTKRPDALLNLAQVDAEANGATDDELCALGPDEAPMGQLPEGYKP
jgi:hypothetical protein